MAVFTQFYHRASPRKPSVHKKTPRTHRAMTDPPRTYSDTITIMEVRPSKGAVPKHILLYKPLPDPPKAEMAQSDVPTGPNEDPATADFEGDLDVADDIPSISTLEQVSDIPVLDVDGKQVPFRSLHEGVDGERKNQRVMVIFIRHFFCGVRHLEHPNWSKLTDHLLELSRVSSHTIRCSSLSRRAPRSTNANIDSHYWMWLADPHSYVH
jgi:hypothetical protein